MHARAILVMVVTGLGAGCGGGTASSDGQPPPDSRALPDGPAGCARSPAPADRARHVVVSHPYDAAGERSGQYEVLDLSPTGALTRPGRTFTMGRATSGTIAFTPDGDVGLLALEDGTLGVFRIDAAGTPTVVHAGFAGSFHASRVVVDPRGDRALVLDGNWREHGGGIYLVTIACDGTLTDHGLLAAAKLPGALAFAGTRAVLAAHDVLDSPTTGHDVHLLGWGDSPAVVAGVDAFGDDLQIVGGAALTPDGATFLVGDTSQFGDVPNGVAVVAITGTGLAPAGRIAVEDPAAIAASPFGNVAVVASAFGDALVVLDTGGAGGAWRVRGEVPYAGADPQLPGELASIERGALRGHVFVAENVSVRHLAFRDTGAVDDLGSLAFGMGLANISGAIGVTP
ncbi:MAG: hypothetical protein M3680_19145 [Myxococcota bacterium]|nr:hypothetical protein [Myxococcota bacterium]